MTAPLCDIIALLLERTYGIDRSVLPLGRFVVGDWRFRQIARERTVRESVDHAGSGARLLLTATAEAPGWKAALYLPDALIAHLESHDPRRHLSQRNIDAFATFVEEIDHLITFSDLVCAKRQNLSLLALEWHAVVSQYLVLTHFLVRLSGRTELDYEQRAFVEHHLFHRDDFEHEEPSIGQRYQEARRRAWRTLEDWRRKSRTGRLGAIRRFHAQLAAA
jgi:hypothetical protein